MLLLLAEGLLKIEDVLPFFPNFVTIDNFKDAICDSLEQYNKQVQLCSSSSSSAAASLDYSTDLGMHSCVQLFRECSWNGRLWLS